MPASTPDPPRGWSGDYSDMGGDRVWGPKGEALSLIDAAGLDKTNLKPLYALLPSQGGQLTLFQTGSPLGFYLWSPDDYTLHKITEPDTLSDIWTWLNTEDLPQYTLPSKRIA